MPDKQGNLAADEGTSTPLHAYRDSRSEDVEGDPTSRDAVEKPAKSGDNSR